MRLRLEEMFEIRIVGRETGCAFRRWKQKALRVIEGITRDCAEATGPHQLWIKGGVDHRGSPALVARPLSARSNEIIVLDTDRHRLRIAEAIQRRVTTRAGVIAMQANELVKEEQAAQLGSGWVERPAKALLQGTLHLAGEPLANESST